MNTFGVMALGLAFSLGLTHAAQPGDVDLSFDVGTGANGPVQSIVVQPDGKILLTGGFSMFGGSPRNGIARLNPDGGLDYSFDPPVPGQVSAIALQPDGKILVGGGGYAERLNQDGSLDTLFFNGLYLVQSIAAQSDGSILLATDQSVYRLNSNGTRTGIYLSFPINTMAVLPGGQIVVAGNSLSSTSGDKTQIARLTDYLGVDNSFDAGWETWDTTSDQYGDVLALAPQADGSLLVGGDFTMFQTISRDSIVRLDNGGTVIASFMGGDLFNFSGTDGAVREMVTSFLRANTDTHRNNFLS
jgi:uncharacterized delta-60 repeat protein